MLWRKFGKPDRRLIVQARRLANRVCLVSTGEKLRLFNDTIPNVGFTKP